jgi:hypothetical protein
LTDDAEVRPRIAEKTELEYSRPFKKCFGVLRRMVKFEKPTGNRRTRH